MNELITITTDEQGQHVVSARDLHNFLEVKTRFASWIERRIEKYGLLQGQDYTTFSQFWENGGRSIEYALTLDAAKELAMVEGNAKGKQARQYFIDADKALRQLMTVLPAQPLLNQQAQRIARLERQMERLLENQQQAARSLLDLPRSTEPLPLETTRRRSSAL